MTSTTLQFTFTVAIYIYISPHPWSNTMISGKSVSVLLFDFCIQNIFCCKPTDDKSLENDLFHIHCNSNK